jgi:hypothetical protein
MHKLTDESLVPKKGVSTGKLRLVAFTLPRHELEEFQRLLSVGRRTPLTQQAWFSGINQAIRELLQDIDVSLRSGKNVSTKPSDDVWFQGYRKFTRSDAKIIINGLKKFNTVVTPIERKYLHNLPPIKGFNQTQFIERYMPEIDKPVSSKVEINSKLLDKLIALKNQHDIFVRDLIAQAIERKSARMRATGLYSDEEHIERPIELDTDKNEYKSYINAFEGLQEEKL